MKRLIAALLLTATPVMAFDISAMSEDEKSAFGDAVREYLMENPEVLVEAINVLEQRQIADSAANDKELVAQHKDELFNDGYSWVGGNPDGDLTMVEFIDYRCGVCRKFNDEVKAAVEEDGSIRLILKEFPILGPDSERSSRFALAAKELGGSDAYAKAHDALIALQGPVTDKALEKIAGDIGVDAAEAAELMESEEIASIIQKNRELGQRMALEGTPSFVIGDELLRGVPRIGVAAAVKEIRAAMSEG